MADQLADAGWIIAPATKIGIPTAQAYMADNNQAISQVVETISHSPVRKDTAIVLINDDAELNLETSI